MGSGWDVCTPHDITQTENPFSQKAPWPSQYIFHEGYLATCSSVLLMGRLRAMARKYHVPHRLLWLNALSHYLGCWSWPAALSWGSLVVYYARLSHLFFFLVVDHGITSLILLVTWTESFVLQCFFTGIFGLPKFLPPSSFISLGFFCHNEKQAR